MFMEQASAKRWILFGFKGLTVQSAHTHTHTHTPTHISTRAQTHRGTQEYMQSNQSHADKSTNKLTSALCDYLPLGAHYKHSLHPGFF